MSEVKQLISRLDNARNSSERLETLERINTFCRSNAEQGLQFLSRLIELLHDESSEEETQECLDILFKLMKFDPSQNHQNITALLQDTSNVELLLDMLEHENITVAVMTSQILSQIHSLNPNALENAIQSCPNGMNKLLQRLPDRSKEEVSNQAIILVQQLTAGNEEMKKTVAFNEGFETIFNIIKSEGGVMEAGVVTEDCLKICRNTLAHSETCQRLFYGMGAGWHLLLTEFFDPVVLETASSDLRAADEQPPMWFENPHRVNCAVLALESLTHSLGDEQPHHQFQNELAIRSTIAVDAAAYWLTRRGPAEVVDAALSFLRAVCVGNAEVSAQCFEAIVKYVPPAKGKTIPLHAVSTAFQFSWRPVPNDDRRLIVLSSLLLERYLFGGQAWRLQEKLENNTSEPSDLVVLDTMLAADCSCSRMLVQFILAPPPPQDEGEMMETSTPFGVHVLNGMLENTSRLLGFSTTSLSSLSGGNPEIGERCANILSLVLFHGDDLTRELTTVLHTGHTCLSGARVPLLTFLLTLVGKSTRVGESGYSFAVSLLRALSSAVFSCDKAARILLDDPANLFILDIASTASESAGVPKPVQISASLFVGACYHALHDEIEQEQQSGGISKAALLSMIDSRIGLQRFTELLKLPLAQRGSKSSLGSLFFTPSFRAFYERLVDAIMQSLFQLYTGPVNNGDSSDKQIISVQQSRIAELEAIISDMLNSHTPVMSAEKETSKTEKLELQSALEEAISRATLNAEEVISLKKTILDISEERERLQDALSQSDRKIRLLEEDLQSPVPFEKARDKRIAELEARNAEQLQHIWTIEAEHSREAIKAKELSLALSRQLKTLQRAVEWEVDEVDHSKLDLEAILTDCLRIVEGCVDSVALIAGNISDMTESAGTNAFHEREGSLARVRECIVYLAGAARERDLLLSDYNILKAQLEAEIIAKEEADQNRKNLEDQIVNLLDQSAAARSEFDSNMGIKDQIIKDLNANLDLLNDNSSVVQTLRDENSGLNAQCLSLRHQLDAKAQELRLLQESNSVIEADRVKLAETVAALKESLKNLEIQIAASHESFDSSQSDLNFERSSRLALEQKLRLEEECLVSAQGSVEYLRNAHDALVSERNGLLTALEEARNEVETSRFLLAQQSDALKTMITYEEFKDLHSELEKKDEALCLLRSELEVANSKIAQSQATLKENDDQRGKYLELEVECMTLKQTVEGKTQELNLLHESKAKAESEISVLTETVADLKVSLVALESQLSDLREGVVVSHNDLISEIASRRELEEKQRTDEKQLASAQALIEQQQKAYSQLLSERDSLLTELEGTKVEVETNRVLLAQQSEALSKNIHSDDVDMLRWELDCEVRSREKLGKELDAATAEIERLRAELNDSGANQKRFQQELASAEKEFTLYREEMELNIARYKELIKELSDSNSLVNLELEMLRSKSKDLSDESSVVAELESKRKECERLRSEVDDARFKIENLTNAVEAEIRAMEAFKIDYDCKMRVISEERDRLFASNERYVEELSDARKRLNVLNDFITKSIKEGESLFSRVGQVIIHPDLIRGNYEQFISSFFSGLNKADEFSISLETELAAMKNESHLLYRYAETEFDAIKSLILWYQNLPIPKTLTLQTFQEFDSIYKFDDAKFKFLDTFNNSLGDLRRNFESILRLGALKDVTTPSKGTTKWNEATKLLEALTPEGKDLAYLKSEIVKERRNIADLKEAHNNLLELLAQQELELSVFRDKVGTLIGRNALHDTEREIRRLAVEKYGSYTNFRG